MSTQKQKTHGSHPVDGAIADERPEKGIVRQLWIDKAVKYNSENPDSNELLYLTLPGEDGREFQLLAEEGLIELTENGGIAESSQLRIAAIESRAEAELNLKRRFPGLKIFPQTVENLIKGGNLLRFPGGSTESAFNAKVINLDLNKTLKADDSDGEISFPIMKLIKKIGQIHAEPPRTEWCLLLTLHGEIHWQQNVCDEVHQFLSANFQGNKDFLDSCIQVLGEDMCNQIMEDNSIDFSSLSRALQQKILNIFVPKKISQYLNDQGWRIETTANYRYGREEDHHAPMVTWAIDFKRDARGNANPVALYNSNLLTIAENYGHIRGDGTISAEE